ncbi:TRM-domain-containing protein [Ceratobasidium sp. AG-I]|nr:TRM-domain-containing protein [Ceratobasidium sp. AG-I]
MSTDTSSALGPASVSAHNADVDAGLVHTGSATSGPDVPAPTSIPESTNDKAEIVAPPGYTIHTENTARILLPSEATAFLNPIQEFNRDLSVACIRTWGKRWDETRREKWENGREARERKRRKGVVGVEGGAGTEGQGKDVKEGGDVEMKVEDAVAGETASETVNTRTNGNEKEKKEKEYISQKFTILEALSATGLRAIRYAHEIPLVKYVIANDISPAATEAMRRNIELNGLGPSPGPPVPPATGDADAPVGRPKRPDMGKVRVSEMDAVALLYSHRSDQQRVEVIDLDPYGSAAPFIDGAVQAVADGGLLCVTCTDMAVLASNNYPEKCYANYGGVPVKAEYCHEVALRLVLHTLSTCAARYGRFITPLLSLSIDFYVRVFVQVRSAPIEVKKAFSKSATYYVCTGCQSFHAQPIGRVVEKVHEGSGNVNLTYKAQSGPPCGPECDECGFKFHLAGPMWSGPIHDSSFASEVLKHVDEDPSRYGTSTRMRGMLTVASEELDTPFYFTPSRLSSFFHCNSPALEPVASALLHKGFEVSRSHACPGSLKTTATRAQVYDIVRSWIKLNPVKMDNIKDGSPAKKLLEKEPIEEADFSTHPKAISRASQVKLVRYQQNPTANWGPGSRPGAGGSKRKREETADS